MAFLNLEMRLVDLIRYISYLIFIKTSTFLLGNLWQFYLIFFQGLLCSGSYDLNDAAKEKLKVADDDVRCGSECICSECCSVVSFQIYDDSLHNCEHCASSNEILNLKKTTSGKMR